MTQGDRRRGKKKYRIRYDRIVILILVIAAIIVIITSCTSGCFGSKDEEGETEPQTTTSPAQSQSTEIPQNSGDQPTSGEPPVVETTYAPVSSNGTISLASEEVFKGDLILVNNDHECKFLESEESYVPVYQYRSELYEAGDFVTKLTVPVIEQMNAMIAEYASYMSLGDTTIFVQDGYRTYADQEARHASGSSKTFSAGHCDYHTGRTVDMYYYDSSSGTGYSFFAAQGDYTWFGENASRYGFIVRYPEGKQEQTGEKPRAYTYRYVGVPHAVYMKQNNLCLEEYISKIRSYTKDAPLEITADGHTYNVYYVTAVEGSTEVPVPADKVYSVSGDNVSGFIVTVTLN